MRITVANLRAVLKTAGADFEIEFVGVVDKPKKQAYIFEIDTLPYIDRVSNKVQISLKDIFFKQ